MGRWWTLWCLAGCLLAPAAAHAQADDRARERSRFTVGDSVAVSAPALPPPRVRAWQTGLLRPDRLHHASFALTSGLAIGLLAREPVAAAGGGFTLGLLKELWDARPSGSGFDIVDLTADAIGAGTSAVLTSGLLR